MANAAAREILAILNGLSVGRIDQLQSELERALRALRELGEEELAARVEDARSALRGGDLKEFRRAIANVTAQVGHLK